MKNFIITLPAVVIIDTRNAVRNTQKSEEGPKITLRNDDKSNEDINEITKKIRNSSNLIFIGPSTSFAFRPKVIPTFGLNYELVALRFHN